MSVNPAQNQTASVHQRPTRQSSGRYQRARQLFGVRARAARRPPSRSARGREFAIIEDGAIFTRDCSPAFPPLARAEIELLIDEDCEVVGRAPGAFSVPGFVGRAERHPSLPAARVDEFEKPSERRRATKRSHEPSGGPSPELSDKRRAASGSDDLVSGRAGVHAEWFLRGGTTRRKRRASGYGLSLEDELKMLRVIRRVHTANGFAICADVFGRARKCRMNSANGARLMLS